MSDPETIAGAIADMPLDGVSAVMSRLVTDHLPTEPRRRQEWGRAACDWIGIIYGKLAGPRDNPWK
jgi:hypothetical protein